MTTKEVAISINNLTKTFKIPLEAHSGIKQKLINTLKGRKGYREFTPLKDISFEIEKGDFFGIVGRNGSGKSTLLKTLAGIYTPDEGQVHISGTLVPFIELGVGFNPELTGRENVFLNGALLGFSHDEMISMYQSIVDFAELHDFMEERLKNYSSGMQVRLAFSIAIRAQADILLLDEVLAVGDEAFQRKCFDYFNQLKQEKKTVILVTHDMGAVERFCTKAVLIKDGKVVMSGDPGEVAKQYTLENYLNNTDSNDVDDEYEPGLSKLVPDIRVTLQSAPVLSSEDELKCEVSYTITQDVPVRFGISVIDEKGSISVVDDQVRDELENKPDTSVKAGTYSYIYNLPLNTFNNRDFTIKATLFKTDNERPVNIAHTAGSRIARFAIRGNQLDGGLLKQKGYWHESELKK